MVKKIPRRTAQERPSWLEELRPKIRLWWEKVTQAAETSRTQVFKRGTEQASRGVMPAGGQSLPISTAGERELCR